LIEKCVRHERKDVPAKRLKEAVADQFRIWRLSRYPTPEHFAKEAVDSTSPWAMEKLTSLRGDKKTLAGRLWEHQLKTAIYKPSFSSSQRYLRSNAFRR
jgi:hypothetical protein